MKKGFDNIPPKVCEQCSKPFFYELGMGMRDWSKKRFCSQKCYFKYFPRENHPLWKGGIKHRPDGYQRDSATDKYIHRQVMEKHLGRKLRKNEQIHHINHNPSDNRLENLLLTKNGEHIKLYHNDHKRDKKGRFA